MKVITIYLNEDGSGGKILSEESGKEFYLIQDTATTDADRPQEGDIIYHPIFEKMFEINFVIMMNLSFNWTIIQYINYDASRLSIVQKHLILEYLRLMRLKMTCQQVQMSSSLH